MATPIGYLTTNSVYFNSISGGDFVFENNDLKIIRNPLKARVQALHDLLISTEKSYYYFPNLGTSLENWIGKGLTEEVKTNIEKYMSMCILDSGLLDNTEFNIYSIIDRNTLYIRIFILEDTEDEIVLNVTYDREKGVTIE